MTNNCPLMETTSREAFILFLRIALNEVSTVINRLLIRIVKAAKRTRLVGSELELIIGARKKIRLNQTIPIDSFNPNIDPSKVPILEGSRPPALRSHKLRPKLKIIDRAVANGEITPQQGRDLALINSDISGFTVKQVR